MQDKDFCKKLFMNLSICRLGGFMKKLVIFGFDGTLADTAPGILYCFNTTAVAMGYEPVEHSALYGVIGAPLEYGFKTLFNMSDDEIEYAVKNYSKLYSQKGKEMFTVYDGIYDALRELKKSGFKLAIATQKHRMFTTDILEIYERRMFSTQYVQQMSVQTSQRVICFCRRVSRQEFPLKKVSLSATAQSRQRVRKK